jgi:hypothetical protein
MRPREKRKDRARRPLVIAKIEVICTWIIEVYGLLDEPQSKHLGVKIQVALRIAGNGGYVV